MKAAAEIRPDVERPRGMVQVPLRREARSRSRRIESWAIFGLFSLAFGAIGYWLVVNCHVVTYDSLDRLARAYLAWHNDPPKLAAIGFSRPPLQTLVLLPFTVIKPLASSLVALPVCSAIFGGLLMVSVNRLLERCAFAAPFRYIILVLLAATPTLCFYASDGGPQIIALYFLAAAMAALIAWFLTVDTRYLIASGMVFALAGLTDYSTLVWAALAALMVMVVLVRHRASHDEVDGSLITFLTPSVYAVALWVLFNGLIVGSPLGWIHSSTAAAINTGAGSAVPVTLVGALHGALVLAWSSAPLALLVIPALLIAAVAQRNELAAWLAAFSLLALLSPAAEAMMRHDASQITLAKGLPLLMMGVYGAACLHKSLQNSRALIAGALIIGLAVSIGPVRQAMNNFPYQNMEQAFYRAVSTGNAQENTTSRGGIQVGFSSELAMAQYIDAHVSAPKSVLTDNAQTYAVMLLSDRPQLFATRVDAGDKPWLRELRHPPASIQYMLLAQNASGDLARQAYPDAVAGQTIGLSVVYQTPRYTLLRVSPGLGTKQVQKAQSTGAPITFSELQSTSSALQPTAP